MKMIVSILLVIGISSAFAAEVTPREACDELAGVLPERIKGEITRSPTRVHPRAMTFNGELASSPSCDHERMGVSIFSPIYDVTNGEFSRRGSALTATFELNPESYMIDRKITRTGGNTTTVIKLRNRRSREGYRDYVAKEEIRITRNARGTLVNVLISNDDKFFTVTATLVPKDWQDPTRM